MKSKLATMIFSGVFMACSLIQVFGEENLQLESESIAHSLYIGAGIIPFSQIDLNCKDKDNPNSNRTIEWYGHGAFLELWYITGLYGYDGDVDGFISLHLSGMCIDWRERADRIDDYAENNISLDKGYTWGGGFSIRGSVILYRAFGMYVEGGLIYSYFKPKNLEPDELVNDAGYFGGTLGLGFYAVYPSRNPVIFDFGGMFGYYLNSSGGDAAWEPEELFVLRVTMNINLY